MSTASVFDQAYVLSKSPDIQKLFAGTMGFPGTALDPTTRMNTAAALSQAGATIDVVIEAQGGDPYVTMLLREQYGYTWVPAAGQPPILLPPGLEFPGLPSYDPSNPPPGSIKVSTNPADYPPFPIPVPVPNNALIVVEPGNGPTYVPGPGANGFKSGTTVMVDAAGKLVANGGTRYTYWLIPGLMGPSAFFTLAQ